MNAIIVLVLLVFHSSASLAQAQQPVIRMKCYERRNVGNATTFPDVLNRAVRLAYWGDVQNEERRYNCYIFESKDLDLGQLRLQVISYDKQNKLLHEQTERIRGGEPFIYQKLLYGVAKQKLFFRHRFDEKVLYQFEILFVK